ncbi:MAG: BolA family protein [Pseudomonadota bacterium]
MTTRLELIEAKLNDALTPEKLEIVDQSFAHAGHGGATQSGGGHYHATIVSSAFEGKTMVQRHQLVYKALGDLMQSEIHALSIKSYTPTEFNLNKE